MRRNINGKSIASFRPNIFSNSKVSIRAVDYLVGPITTLNDISGNNRAFSLAGAPYVAVNAEGKKYFPFTSTNFFTDAGDKIIITSCI